MKWGMRLAEKIRYFIHKIKQSYFERDESSHRRDVVHLAWPVLIELLLGSFFGMVDMMMLGQIPDPATSAAAVASVGITNQPLFLGLSMAQAINVGGTAMIARYYGANRKGDIQDVLKHTLIFSFFVVAIPYSLLMQMFAVPVMQFIGAEPIAIEVGLQYFRIIMVSFIFQSVTMSLTAALRGVGETRIPMRINLFSNGLNVIGNALLIHGLLFFPRLGVTGAALSTAIANFIGMLIMIYVFLKGDAPIRLDFKQRFRFSKDIIYNLVKIGLPSAGEQLVLRIGLVAFTRVVSGLGTVIFAAHQTSLSILSLSFSLGQAFGISASTLVGQSLGRNEPDEAEHLAREARRLGTIFAIVLGAIFFLFGMQIASLYSTNAAVIVNAAMVLRIIGLVQPFQASQLIMSGGMRGAGDTVFTMITTLIGILIIRVSLANLFVRVMGMGLEGAWYATFMDQFVRWALVTWRFRSGKWKAIKLR